MVDPRVGRGMFSTLDADHPLARYPLDHVFHTGAFTLYVDEDGKGRVTKPSPCGVR